MRTKVLLLSSLIIIAICLSYYYLQETQPYLFSKLGGNLSSVLTSITPSFQANPSPSPSPTLSPDSQPAIPLPTRSPYPLVPDEGTKGNFSISQPKHDGPIFTKIVIDPLDAKIGDKITITFTLTSSEPISSLTGNVETDQEPIKFRFTRQSRKDQTEIWTTTFQLKEPILYKYLYHLTAKDRNNTVNYELPLRN